MTSFRFSSALSDFCFEFMERLATVANFSKQFSHTFRQNFANTALFTKQRSDKGEEIVPSTFKFSRCFAQKEKKTPFTLWMVFVWEMTIYFKVENHNSARIKTKQDTVLFTKPFIASVRHLFLPVRVHSVRQLRCVEWFPATDPGSSPLVNPSHA